MKTSHPKHRTSDLKSQLVYRSLLLGHHLIQPASPTLSLTISFIKDVHRGSLVDSR